MLIFLLLLDYFCAVAGAAIGATTELKGLSMFFGIIAIVVLPLVMAAVRAFEERHFKL